MQNELKNIINKNNHVKGLHKTSILGRSCHVILKKKIMHRGNRRLVTSGIRVVGSTLKPNGIHLTTIGAKLLKHKLFSV